MKIKPLLYRSGKPLVKRLPAWLFRARPFGIFEIQLAKSSTNADRMVEEEHGFECQIEWIANQAEASGLRSVANPQTIATFDAQSRRVVAAWLDGQIIGCAWIATNSFEEQDLGIRFQLQPTEVWLFAAVVGEPYRNQGVYRQLLQFLCEELSRTEVQRILLGVASGNEPSRRSSCQARSEANWLPVRCSEFGINVLSVSRSCSAIVIPFVQLGAPCPTSDRTMRSIRFRHLNRIPILGASAWPLCKKTTFC